jgi:hypothetical protein
MTVYEKLYLQYKVINIAKCWVYRVWTSWILIDWLIDYDGVKLCLRTAATNVAIVHSLGDMWTWRAMAMMIPAEDNRFVHQSSLAVLSTETSGALLENFVYQYLKYLKECFTCRKILRRGTSGFTSPAKEGVLRILSPLKIHRLGRVWTHNPLVQWQAR